MDHCGVCARINLLKEGKNRYFVRETETGYVVLGDYQRFPGYTVFICKEHACELWELPHDFRAKFLMEMAAVAEAVARAFHADKMNCELLGAGRGKHMHWHLFPRRAGETPDPGPVWRLPKEELNSCRPSPEKLAELKAALTAALEECGIQHA